MANKRQMCSSIVIRHYVLKPTVSTVAMAKSSNCTVVETFGDKICAKTAFREAISASIASKSSSRSSSCSICYQTQQNDRLVKKKKDSKDSVLRTSA